VEIDTKLLIVDCFDSFTYNLYHILEDLNGGNCEVMRYDRFDPNECREYSHIVLSPGPGLPADYPQINNFLKHSEHQNILGVCLGLQCMVNYYGGKLEQLEKVKHGVSTSLVIEEETPLFKGIKSPLKIGHYHSWVAEVSSFPLDHFKVTSKSSDGEIMSLQHLQKPWAAVQFHPESVLTDNGPQMLENWLNFKWF